MNEVWLVVIIFIIIAVILALLLWAFWPKVTASPTSTQNTEKDVTSGFLQSCNSGQICNTGLTCISGICLKEEGQPCKVTTDCAPPNQCLGGTENKMGVCSSSQSGTLNNLSPCNRGLTPNDDGVCKLNIGSSGCTVNGKDLNNNCISGICVNNVCRDFLSLGQPCQTGQCGSGLVCSRGFCQTQGVTTGTSGATCNQNGNPGCNMGLFCNDDNICTPGDQQFGESCDDLTSFCQLGLVCNENICTFPSPPGDCSVSQACTNLYTCTNGTCFGNPGAICSVDSECLSNNCQYDQVAIFRTSPKASGQGWELLTNLPLDIKFDKFITTDTNNNDVIWGLNRSSVIGGGGLYLLTDPMVGAWIKTISANKLEIINNIITTTTILTIATDGTNVYALTRLDITRDSQRSIKWIIQLVQLQNDNSVLLISIPQFNPPMVNGTELVNITDMDFNRNQDVLVVGNTDLQSDSNFIYTKRASFGTFKQVKISSFSIDSNLLARSDVCYPESDRLIVNPPNKIKTARFYYLRNSPVDNSENIAYIPTGEYQQVLFTGLLGPENGRKGSFYPLDSFNFNYKIPDLSSSSSLTNSNIWINAINLNDPNRSSILAISNGKQFQIPGYNDENTKLYVSDRFTYLLASGICS